MHSHGAWHMSNVYPAWAVRGTSVRLVCAPRGTFAKWAMRHGSKAKKVFWPLVQKPAFRAADCWHATAESEYLDIRRFGFRQPVAIVPNGIDMPTATSHRPRINQDHHTLLYLSRLHYQKGLDDLLEAWAAVHSRFPNWTLKIFGDEDTTPGRGGYRQSLLAKAAALGLKNIEISGAVYGQAKEEAFANADLFVLPSFSENFGVAVAESLVRGTPVITTKGTPWSGLIENRAGWWVDCGSEPLAAALNTAMGCSSDQLAAMGERGRAWMQEDFSWAEIGRRMLTTYRWVCDPRRPVPEWVRLD